MHIVLIPKKWWSVKEWKFVLDFNKHFVSGFITKEDE
jgi:hypothetical protein